jgi:urea transport system permease protein
VLVNGAKTLFTGWFPELWTFALGALFVLVTLWLPRGVLGGLDALAGLRPSDPRKPPRGRARQVGPAESLKGGGGERLEPAE